MLLKVSKDRARVRTRQKSQRKKKAAQTTHKKNREASARTSRVVNSPLITTKKIEKTRKKRFCSNEGE
jgi:hypothetical protein